MDIVDKDIDTTTLVIAGHLTHNALLSLVQSCKIRKSGGA